MVIEHVDAVIDMRRFLTLERGAAPARAAQALEEVHHADNPDGYALAVRTDWAVDLRLPVLREVQHADILLWLGDGAFDRRVQRSLRALVKLLRAASVEFAVLG